MPGTVARIDAAKIIVDEMLKSLQPDAEPGGERMNYWLFKTEPGCFSFTDLKNRPGMTEHWDGVRNFQARNFLRDAVKRATGCSFITATFPQPAIVGIAEVAVKGILILRRVTREVSILTRKLLLIGRSGIWSMSAICSRCHEKSPWRQSRGIRSWPQCRWWTAAASPFSR